MVIKGELVDIHSRKLYSAEIEISAGRIAGIKALKRSNKEVQQYILPGLIDSHIHIESSLCTPGSFAVAAVSRGTTGVVSDPHEIANVMGIRGIDFMLEEAEKVPLKFWFGAPSCVPATPFESAGAEIGPKEIKKLMGKKEIKYLAEMMNFPGVIEGDKTVMEKLKIARELLKTVDGHAPGLRGENLKKYVSAGVTTDHECSSKDEALEKISLGMKVLIREGSAAKNLQSLKTLLNEFPEMTMLCSDDLHPEMLVRGHINKLVSSLLKEGFNLFDTLRSCTINPAEHYKLEAGMLRRGDPADFIVVDKLSEMNVLETWINGKKVFDRGRVLFKYSGTEPVNNFKCSPVIEDDIKVRKRGDKIRVIEAFEGELLTNERFEDCASGEWINPMPDRDILKIVVKDRYNDKRPAVGFIKGFGLKDGAFAGSVAHDSHNIICIGTNDNDIVSAINEIVKMKGGLAVAFGGNVFSMPLPVAGIMSDRLVTYVAKDYENLSEKVKLLGCRLSAPFMTLSFMALLVIPELKLSDRGLFDGRTFRFVSLFA